MTADIERVDRQLSELRRMGSLPPNLQRAVDRAESRAQTRSTAMNQYPSNVYRGAGQSYVRDLARVALNSDDTNESRRRLAEHAQELESRDLSRVDGSGGYAVPPAWLMSQYIGLPRAARPFANLVQRQPLPGGTDSINIPKVLTGTKTGVQVADNTAVSNIDLTDTFINAPVRTIAGEQSLALQLIDQSPIAFDEVIFSDLSADHDRELDRQTLFGSGLSGQVLGALSTPGIGSVAIASLDIAGYFNALANAIKQSRRRRP
jgi:HK97 family phage major capsid protein